MKQCTKCGTEKELSEFQPDPRYRHKHKTHCRTCVNAYERSRRAKPGPLRDKALAKSREWNSQAAESGYFWQQHLLKKYGLTRADYEQLEVEQGGVCAICSRPESDVGRGGKIKPLAVDHCHESGMVRGLLCHGCNVGSNWDTIPDWPALAAAYLSRFQRPA